MPAVSESQRRLIFARFGSAWAHKHHFANKGKLPARVGAPKRSTTDLAVQLLKRREQALERKGGPKTPAELRLEQQISRRTGKPYVGRR